MPGGLFPDEAANGLDVDLITKGDVQPFYERGNGREALYFYMLWPVVTLFGKGPWQHHSVSAIIGVLSVFVSFLAAKRLFLVGVEKVSDFVKNRAINIALLAAFLMAVSTWHIVLSRTAFRAILIPLFVSLTFYLLLKTYQSVGLKKQLIFSFLTGATFALGFYTYIAYRILVPILGVLILWPLLASLKEKLLRFQIKKYWKATALFLVAFFIFFYPLGKYFIDHPGSFVGRSGQVSVFNKELNNGNLIGTAAEVGRLSVVAYFTNGDLNWRHNISGLPFLPGFVSPFFGIALIVITFLAVWYLFAPSKRKSFWKYALLAGWFWGMLLPVVTTAEGIPHGLRSIGTIPVVFIIAALGLYKFGELVLILHKRIWGHYSVNVLRKRIADFGLKTVFVVFIISSILYSYSWYFVYAKNSPSNFYSFRSDLTAVSDYLISRCDKNNTYLVLDKFSVQTPDYITNIEPKNPSNPCNKPYIQVDPENVWELNGLTPADEIVFTQSSLFDTTKFKKFHPESYLSSEVRNKFNQTVMAVYRIQN